MIRDLYVSVCFETFWQTSAFSRALNFLSACDIKAIGDIHLCREWSCCSCKTLTPIASDSHVQTSFSVGILHNLITAPTEAIAQSGSQQLLPGSLLRGERLQLERKRKTPLHDQWDLSSSTIDPCAKLHERSKFPDSCFESYDRVSVWTIFTNLTARSTTYLIIGITEAGVPLSDPVELACSGETNINTPVPNRNNPCIAKK